ncbi:MAG: Phosphatidylserine decarboxylase proenzyme [Firmicutes bacterium]|nr:Phosphatidylserine decarboxylase proenzyme [candidate division NPL-UPA2 bacterium]
MKLLLAEGRTYIAIVAVLAIALFAIHPLLLSLPLFGLGFLLYFFRDPKRDHPPAIAGEIDFLAPADGRVTVVDVVHEPYLFRGSAQMVTIFLSPLDVHVNRSPISGHVKAVEHRQGKFRPAYLADAPSVNERNYLVVQNSETQCLLVQIVGIVARRVVCWAKVGEELQRGEKFGLMKFGSSLQVFMPPETEMRVKQGARVVGGETVIGVIRRGAMV